MNYFSKSKIFSPRAGFTLIEFIVVMSIAIILITSLVIQQSKWNDTLTVNTQAYELALTIRQAQIYSLGVREYSAGGNGRFDIGYGVYFDQNFNRYIYFADADKDQKYDAGEELETKTFTRGVTIERICGKRNSSEQCSNPLDHINVSFIRPEPGANINFLNSGDQTVNNVDPPALIYLRSLGNKQYKVTIETNGQVSISQI